jgi:hypothetical protein
MKGNWVWEKRNYKKERKRKRESGERRKGRKDLITDRFATEFQVRKGKLENKKANITTLDMVQCG